MIEVAHKRSGKPGIYIGRPSPFGNPFRIGECGDRKTVIAKYDTWIRNELRDVRSVRLRKAIDQLVEFVQQGNDLVLLCYCAPLACHGDVIKTIIEERLECDLDPSR